MICSKLSKFYPILVFILLIFYSEIKSSNSIISDEIDTLKTTDFLFKAKQFEDHGNYDSSIFYYIKSEKNSILLNEWETQANCLINISNIYKLKDDIIKAKEYLSDAENIIRTYSDTNSFLYAEVLHVKGTISLNQHDFINSIKFLNNSINLKKNINVKNDTTLGKSFYDLGTNFFFLGKYDSSLNYYYMSLKNDLLRANKFCNDIADSYRGIGIIYAIQSKNDSAIYYLLKSLDIKKDILDDNSPSLASIYSNVGRILSLNNDFEKAINFYDMAEKIYINNFGNRYFKLSGIYQNKGTYYYLKENFDKALLYTRNAISIYLEKFDKNDQRILALYMNMGLYHEKKGEYPQAFDYYNKSLSKNKNSISDIKTLRNLANLYKKLNKLEQADNYYAQCMEKTIDLLGYEHKELALDYLYYGSFLALKEDYEKSIEFLQRSYKIYIEIYGNKNRDVANVQTELSRVFSLSGELDSALLYSQKALIAISPDFKDTNYYVSMESHNFIPDPNLFVALIRKAETLLELYNKNNYFNDLETSLKTFESAICVSDTLQTSYISSEESKLIFSNIIKSTFSNAIKTAIQLYNLTGKDEYLEKAFTFSEKSKAAVLFSSMKNVAAMDYSGISESLQKLEKNLQNKIRTNKKLIYDEKIKSNPDEKKIRQWEDKIFIYDQAYDSLIAEFEKNNKEYYSLKYDITTKNYHEIQKKLNPNDIIVEFTVSDSSVFIFAITKDRFQVIDQAIDSTYFSQIATVRNSFNKNSIINHSFQDYKQFVDAAYKLYLTLLSPIENLIEEKKIIIIPDDKLGYIPFGTLLYDNPDTSKIDYRNLPYLIKKNNISYSYSANLLFNNNEDKSPVNDEVLLIGPTYENTTRLDSNHLLFSYGIHGFLVELPNSKGEISKINEIFDGISLIDSDATESNFKQKSKDFDILHLAMHTIVNDTNPMFSKLIFTLDNDTVQDGFLNTYEIYSLELNARMAVLSACNTGSGKLQRGEGIMSLARGFIYAGVPSIIMTLWEVDDVSGSEIMAGFYSYLKEGFSKDEAIRLAKIDYLTTANQIGSHPYFWSAYVGIGNTRPLVSNPNTKIIWIVSILTCLIIFSFLFYKWKLLARKK
ncbi:MAG: CHAT domain-containing protein [Bacteroidales bacterium]|nr:CHAT domain-containing protein [Bacteroidales bacterium]